MVKIERRRGGKYEFLALVTVLFMTLLIGFLANVGYTIRKKVEVQNAADSIAYSSAVWAARGLNTITATNHLMGELLAFGVWHDAIAGHVDEDYHKEKDRWGTPALVKAEFLVMIGLNELVRFIRIFAMSGEGQGSDGMEAVYDDLAEAGGIPRPGKTPKNRRDELRKDGPADPKDTPETKQEKDDEKRVETLEEMMEEFENEKDRAEAASDPTFFLSPIKCGGAIREAKIMLLQEIALTIAAYITAYGVYVAAAIACIATGPGFLVCEAEAYAALQKAVRVISIIDRELEREWRYLSKIEDMSEKVGPATQFMVNSMVPNGASFARQFHESMPRLTAATTAALGEKLSVKPRLSGLQPGLNLNTAMGGKALPLERQEAGKELDDDKNSRIQLLRATWPWVKFWRRPMLIAFAPAPLSCASGHYFHWTTILAREWAWRKQTDLPIYVIKGTTTENKGKETWTTVDGSAEAEKLFGMVGMAIREKHSVASPSVWGKPIVNTAAFAQSIVYNANDQAQPVVESETLQPEVGWDTLNWTPPAASNNAYEFYWFDEIFADDWGYLLNVPAGPGFMLPAGWEGAKAIGLGAPAAQINWQAKLVPATAVRPGQVDPGILQFLLEADLTPAYSTELITH